MEKKHKVFLGIAALVAIVIIIAGFNIMVSGRSEYVKDFCVKNNYKYAYDLSCVQTDCTVKCCADDTKAECRVFDLL